MSRLKLILVQTLWILLSIIIYTPLSSQDNTPPEITIPAISLTVPCSSTNILGNLTTWYNDNGGAEATDNSGSVSFIASPSLTNAISTFEASSDSLCGLTKSVEVTFIAVDPSGNESQPTVAKFSTFDNVNPIVATPAQNVTVSCNLNIRDSLISWIQVRGNAVVTDACSDTIIWTTFVSNLPPFGSFPIDQGPYPNLPSDRCDLSVNITFFAEDDCGNRTTTSGTFRITDNTGPVFDTLPPDITVSCDNLPEPTTLIGIDDCYGEVIVNFEEENNQNSDSTSCEHFNYDILRIWEAQDLCGNSTTHRQVISVRDLNPPTIEVTNPLIIGCKDILAGNVLNLIDTLYDDCSDSLTVSFTDNGTISNCEYSLLRIYSVKDLCDNETQTVQTLLIRDTIPPTITVAAKDSVYDCIVEANFNQIFQNWLDDYAGSQSIDECSRISVFPAVPGSYDINDPFSFPGQDPDTFDMNICPSGLNGFLRFETVDFLHIDECQNISVTTATFGIVDNSTPTITACPPDITVTLEQDNCTIEVSQIFPSAEDNCTATTSPLRQSDVTSVTSSDPGNPEVIVDTVRISIGPFNNNTFTPLSSPIFEVSMQNLDADDNSEFFTIFNESGINIGQTPSTSMQCGDTTFTIANQSFEDLVLWLEDGFIDFTFVPNVPPSSGVLGINAVCSGARLTVEAIIDINPINTLNAFYQVNNENPVTATIGDSIFFDVSVGPNDITYYFEDCASNQATCTQTITANDIFPPEIDCGDTLNFNLDTNQCNVQLGFPLDIAVSENCQFAEAYRQTVPFSEEAQLMIFEYDSVNMVHLATNRLFTFNNVERIAYGNEAFLFIEVSGDLNDIGETINIRGEDGVSLGTTQIIQKQGCQQTILSVAIPRSAFNLWAGDGKIDILAITPTGIIEGGGINPCVPISPEMTVDGVSSIKATLVYYDAQIKYTINGDTTLFNLDNTQDSIFVDLINGENFIDFEVEDLGGNISSCKKIIYVNDSIPPNAICRNGIVEIHPSGLISSVVNPDSINESSFDNCEITELIVNSDTLTCEDVGSNITATLFVFDDNNNVDSCQANVEVISYILSPFFTAGICSGDTLKLFANVPEAPVQNTYSYEWSKDGVIISNEENPIIPNATSQLNGLYTLVVNGFAGCTSEGSIQVNIMPLTKPELNSSSPSICFGEIAELSCTAFSGQVVYSWYQGIYPDGILVGTSSVPSFEVVPTITNNTYYVIANNSDCETPPSDQLTIEVYTKPIPEVEQSFITICEGDLISLKAINDNPEYQYMWIGPGNFMSDLKEPTPFPASSSREGEYKLVISIGECTSDTSIVTITTLGRPETPIINGESIYCKGSTFSLAVNNVTNGTTYMWYQNGLLFRTTQDNSLDIPNAQTDLTGDWSVVVIRDGCSSLSSDIQSITVDDLINVGATNSGPICAGDILILDATFVPNASYQWSGPGFSASGQTVMAPSVAGDYSVTITTPTNCSNVASTEVIVNTPPEITALSAGYPACITNSTVITFSPTIFPIGTYEYQWTGPNGFTSDILNPIISDLEESDKGTYTLTVLSQGCESDPVDIDIDFGFKPNTPNIIGDLEYCQGDSIVLSSINSTGNIYNWITPMGTIITNNDSLIISSATLANEGFYSLVSQEGNCTSDTSNILSLIIKEIPTQPTINGNNDICFGSPLILSTNITNAENYTWTLPDNSTINNDSVIILSAKKEQEGSYQLVYEVDGCESFVSDMFVVEVRDSIITPQFLNETLSFCSDLTESIEICMSPGSITPGTTYSLTNVENNQTVAETNGICFNINNPENFNDGSNQLTIIGENDGCFSNESEGIIILFQSPPDIKAQVFDDLLIACAADEFLALESFNGPPEVDVKWSALTPGILINNENSVSALASNFLPGENLIKLSYSKDGCNDFSSDTVSVFLEPSPMLEDDEFNIAFNSSTTIDIFNNDILPENLEFSFNDNGIKGMFVDNGTTLTFKPDEGLVGTFTFEYEVCVPGCPSLCENALVTLNIGLDHECGIPSIFTPNQDGINDYFIIPCLDSDRYDKNKLFIFNEWGDEVFSASPYDNSWDGTYGGEPLPVGTYFIVFEPGEGTAPIRGFLMLQR